ncbi:MAG: family 10 glycosylhydrolase [Candidatus Latescibacterota bacterium]|nr:family 10 glycosylhydrolase [Candidatus Latescibacterota bacterium]
MNDNYEASGPAGKTVATMLAASLALGACSSQPKVPEGLPPGIPSVQREFRAVWVASVANINWPSEPGLPVERLRQQALAILDTVAAIGMNAVILQVRPQCDALYASELEPWSYYLTGEQGIAPADGFDPLEFWVEEAHDRGLELHAWFNPYRAHHPKGAAVTDASIVRQRPEMVVRLGEEGYWWLDPSRQDVQEHSRAVVMDVVRRYDIDGVHFDDYFYPYPSYNEGEDFPDDESWELYRENAGHLNRADWRRASINRFLKNLYEVIKKEKRHVKFGLSPFGVWRPGHPASIQGLDQYEVLYADARLWLRQGWADYFTPQLYWSINQVPQSFPVLLGWWMRQNVKGRNLWPGVATGRARNEAGVDEVINEIMVARGFASEAPGHVHWSVAALMTDSTGFTEALRQHPYREPAIVPPSPWLDAEAPAAPTLSYAVMDTTVTAVWTHLLDEDVFLWVLYIERAGGWNHELYNRGDRVAEIAAYEEVSRWRPGQGGATGPLEPISRIAVSAVDRNGNESWLTVVDLSADLPPLDVPEVAPKASAQ